MKRFIVGVMGGGEGIPRQITDQAYDLGKRIAENGWVLLNGGRNLGIMEASAKGAREAGGLTVGILPDSDTNRMSQYVDIPILTGMGDARNSINVLSSDVVVIMPGGAGTLSEAALALKSGKDVILLGFPLLDHFQAYKDVGQVQQAVSVEAVISWIEEMKEAHWF